MFSYCDYLAKRAQMMNDSICTDSNIQQNKKSKLLLSASPLSYSCLQTALPIHISIRGICMSSGLSASSLFKLMLCPLLSSSLLAVITAATCEC